MGRKLTRTNEEWLELYYQQRNSGLNLREWCELNGINAHTFADRASKLRKMGMITDPRPPGGRYPVPNVDVVSSKQAWVEVKAPPEMQSNPSAAGLNQEIKSSCGIGIEVGNFKLTLSKYFCEETLLRLCKILVNI